MTQDFMQYEGYQSSYGKMDFVSPIDQIPVEDRYFDAILCTEVLEHVPEPIAAIRGLSRILKPGGRIFVTAPLGSGLHRRPYHFYGGYTPEWYERFFSQYQLDLVEIVANGGFFKHLAQEYARVSWTFDQHRHLHGVKADEMFTLFNETLPTYLYHLEDKCFIADFTVGFHVEGRKRDV
jgi:ubiquinone/menaquinone biosynthesis C-methylase UbiE